MWASGSNMCVCVFSSRRRHTSSLCDWSSDVCSSDLECWDYLPGHEQSLDAGAVLLKEYCQPQQQMSHTSSASVQCHHPRSEERRVGKECRSRSASYH